jgi:hypothetical protein
MLVYVILGASLVGIDSGYGILAATLLMPHVVGHILRESEKGFSSADLSYQQIQ